MPNTLSPQSRMYQKDAIPFACRCTTTIAALLLSLALIICSFAAGAQDFPMVHYGVEDGLPSNTVYEIYRDSKGFLWIATDKGVARYNGIKFEIFTTADGLADNEVFYFQEDLYGRIWMATMNGALCYYRDGKFHNETNTPFLKLPFKLNYTAYINAERDSSVTIGFSGITYIVNVSGNTTSVFNPKNEHNENILSKLNLYVQHGVKVPMPFYSAMSARKINDSEYRAFYPNTLIRFNKRTGNISNTTFDFHNEPKYLTFSQNKKIYYTDSNAYDENWNIIYKHPAAVTRTLVNESSAWLRRLVVRIYFGTDKVFYIVDNNALYEDSTLIMKKNGISSITQDVTGNYWLSTITEGIFMLDRSFKKDRVYEKIYTDKIKYSCVKRNNLLYATDYNNIYCLNDNKAECLYNYRQLQNGQYRHPSEPAYLLDSSDKLHYFYDYNYGILDHIFSKKITARKYTSMWFGVKSIYLVNNQLLINNSVNMAIINYNTLRPEDTLYNNVSINKNNDNSERILCSAQAGKQDVWYCTQTGFYKIVNGKVELQPQLKNITLKTFGFFGNYLVGYLKNTLYIYNGFEKIKAVDSIIDKNCIWDKFYKIDSNHLLISTNNYYRVLTLFPSQGRPEYEILTVENPMIPLRTESICSDGSNCYFFKNGTITSINVSTLCRKPGSPQVYFSSLRIGGQLEPVNSEYTASYEKAKNMALSFLAVSFSSKEVRYQYSISKNGTDNWNNIEGTEIPFINPNFGNYIIKVRAKTLSSGYSAPITFLLHIRKPFWATLWFISLTVAGTGIIIAMVVRRRLSFLMAKKEQAHSDKVKSLKSEYKALNALMNPHFIFNTLNNVQSLFNGDNKLAANEYLRVFADLIRQNMHNVSKELIPLQKEVDLVGNYLMLEKLRFEDKLNYKLHIDEDLELYEIMIPPLLIQPLVENSIKHGILPMQSGNGVVQVNISEQDGILKIEVKDNGVGLNNSQQKAGSLHESFGLDNIRKRIEQLGIIQNKEITFGMGSIVDADNISWTVVTVRMPL